MTVAVLLEREETEVPILTKDLRIETFRSSGAGGQHVNTTDSAIRITHLPSGLVVSCQAGRSQHDNKDKALKVLRARLFAKQEKYSNQKEIVARKKQIGLGMRSEKIRTYNHPQNRVTDHRIKLTIKNIEKIMNGDFEVF
ncbi:MAG: peptide chain release factor-like protein [Mollicutes bacterium]|nr:MAG: peptide chain release factor-like protein [Mollicutes bacterium]